jgi:hypothetical protein
VAGPPTNDDDDDDDDDDKENRTLIIVIIVFMSMFNGNLYKPTCRDNMSFQSITCVSENDDCSFKRRQMSAS